MPVVLSGTRRMSASFQLVPLRSNRYTLPAEAPSACESRGALTTAVSPATLTLQPNESSGLPSEAVSLASSVHVVPSRTKT